MAKIPYELCLVIWVVEGLRKFILSTKARQKLLMHLLTLVKFDPVYATLLLLQSLNHRLGAKNLISKCISLRGSVSTYLILVLYSLLRAHTLSEVETVDLLRYGEHPRSV